MQRGQPTTLHSAACLKSMLQARYTLSVLRCLTAATTPAARASRACFRAVAVGPNLEASAGRSELHTLKTLAVCAGANKAVLLYSPALFSAVLAWAAQG